MDKNMLKHLIEYRDNDYVAHVNNFKKSKDERIKCFQTIDQLIISCTRKVLNFRYCPNALCICSPESDIKRILATLEGKFIIETFKYPSMNNVACVKRELAIVMEGGND